MGKEKELGRLRKFEEKKICCERIKIMKANRERGEDVTHIMKYFVI